MASYTPENPPPNHYPITGFCVVSAPEKCPTGYQVISKTNDDQADASLGTGSFFSVRPPRYLCFTRFFPLDNGRLNNVMIEINLIGERDSVPMQYTIVDRTLDTGDKALHKKQLVAKMVPRHTAPEAICDLAVLTGKKPPTNYTMTGDVNGSLSLIYKKSPVPEESRFTGMLSPQDVLGESSSSATTDINNRTSNENRLNYPPLPPLSKFSTAGPGRNTVEAQTGNSLLRHSTSGRALATQHSAPGNPVDDIPFKLAADDIGAVNRKLATSLNLPKLQVKSLAEIEREFGYDFSLERSVLNGVDNKAAVDGRS